MGELFRRKLPAQPLEWTGERLVSGLTGAIESEHLHRYFVAREFCRSKHVLDVACGEGYGSALVAQTAHSVIGVDADFDSVKHAMRAYDSSNLRYLHGNATCLPVESESVDVVVSFETLEHVAEQELFFAEVLRVLRPDGLLIISTPDSEVYSASGTSPNPFHIRELTEAEFRACLGKAFRNTSFFRQRASSGSTIWPDNAMCRSANWIYDQRSGDTFEAHRTLPRAPYLFALASNGSLPCLSASILLRQESGTDATVQSGLHRLAELEAENIRLRDVEAAYRRQDPIITERLAEAAVVQNEAARLRVEVSQLSTEVSNLRAENGELRRIEAEYHRQDAVIAERLAAAAKTQQEAQQLNDVSQLQGEVCEAKNQLEALRAKLAEAGDRAKSYEVQLEAATLINRQQTFSSQRLQRELSLRLTLCQDFQTQLQDSHQQLQRSQAECEAAKSNARHFEALALHWEQISANLAGLIIPVRMRKLFPPSLRASVRSLKKSLTFGASAAEVRGGRPASQ